MRALCGDSTESTTECLARQTELLRRICLISQGGQELFCASLCVSTKSVIGAPVHSFGLIGEIFRHIRRASQLHANRLRSTEGAAVPSLALAIVRKLVAVPTSKDRTAIDDGYSARTASGGAEEPDSFPSVVAWPCGPERLDTLHPSNPHRISDADSEGRRGRTRRIRQQIQPRPRSLTSSDLSIHRAAGSLHVAVPECLVGDQHD